jgi:hypothetical protein
MTKRAFRSIGLGLGWGLSSGLALLGAALPARADDHGPRVPMPPKYLQECASCHAAYPPGLLPAPSWQRVMGNLSKHYGTDASLDAATVQELTGWLTAQAGASSGRRAREAPPQDRITLSAWFVREHDELRPATWKLPAVKSPSNCSACHTRADQGEYRERDIRIPR